MNDLKDMTIDTMSPWPFTVELVHRLDRSPFFARYPANSRKEAEAILKYKRQVYPDREIELFDRREQHKRWLESGREAWPVYK